MGISYWELGIGLNRKKQDTKNKEAQWREKNKKGRIKDWYGPFYFLRYCLFLTDRHKKTGARRTGVCIKKSFEIN